MGLCKPSLVNVTASELCMLIIFITAHPVVNVLTMYLVCAGTALSSYMFLSLVWLFGNCLAIWQLPCPKWVLVKIGVECETLRLAELFFAK